MKKKKTVQFNQLTKLCSSLRRRDKEIVLCHGCFDFLHFGHLRHFKAAKREGDVLVVTVTPDQYINKGPDRPFYTIRERIEFLAELESIDYVCVNLWPTAAETIETIKPHVYIKGGEYRGGNANQDARFRKELQALEKINGRMVFTDEVTLSSSHILKEWVIDETTTALKPLR